MVSSSNIFSMGTNFADVNLEEVVEEEAKLNRRPRKYPDYQNPDDIFFAPLLVALAA